MAGRRIGDNPLSEPMLTRFTDAYMRHWGWGCGGCGGWGVGGGRGRGRWVKYIYSEAQMSVPVVWVEICVFISVGCKVASTVNWWMIMSYRGHFVNEPIQWETTLHCSVVSGWLTSVTYMLTSYLTHCEKIAAFCRRHFQMHFLRWKCMNFA